MEMKNRQSHMPIPVTAEVMKDQKRCPCCKCGIIVREEGAPMASCSECGQRYQVKDKEVGDGEVANENS